MGLGRGRGTPLLILVDEWALGSFQDHLNGMQGEGQIGPKNWTRHDFEMVLKKRLPLFYVTVNLFSTKKRGTRRLFSPLSLSFALKAN